MNTDGLKNLIPYYGERKVRAQIDKVFSRQVLGSILLGKFIGDYAAITMTDLLGQDVGYILGIVIAFSVFVYWDMMASAAGDVKEKGAEKAKDAKEKAQEKKDEVKDE